MSTQNTNPSFAQTLDTGGNGTAWVNLPNLLAPSAGATSVLFTRDNNHYSQVILATNIQFRDSGNSPITIPVGSIINSITLTVQAQRTSGTSAAYMVVNLLGVPGSQTFSNGPWPSGLNTFNFGSGWWGAPQATVDMLNSPGFGFTIQVICTQLPGSGIDALVKQATVEVNYTSPGIPVTPPGGENQDQSGIFNFIGTGGPPPPPPPLVVSQFASAYFSSGDGPTAVPFTNTPTPGNILVFLGGTYYTDSVAPPSGLVLQSSFNPVSSAQSMFIYTRVVQAGDGKDWIFTLTGSDEVAIAGYEVAATSIVSADTNAGLSGQTITTNILASSTRCIVLCAFVAGNFWTFTNLQPSATYPTFSPLDAGGTYRGVSLSAVGTAGHPIPNSAITIDDDTIVDCFTGSYATIVLN